MDIKFIVTTRIECLKTLKEEGYYLVGIDGTVPNSRDMYDELYDHHRKGGGEVQMDEIGDISPYRPAKKIAMVTTMVDADAIVASYGYLTPIFGDLIIKNSENYKLLRAVSFDCDHLAVPKELEQYGKDAAMIVAALKEESNSYVAELGLPSNRREWTIEQKELFGSYCFEKGVMELIPALLNGTWNYEKIAQSYWEQVEKNTDMLISEGRISVLNGVAIFDGKGLNGTYIDPRCWYRALDSLNLNTYTGIALTQREVIIENEFKGYSYTIGKIPLSDFNADFTDGLFSSLTEAEKAIRPDADGWGGRSSVGGSGWNTPSNLSPDKIVEIINNWFSQ